MSNNIHDTNVNLIKTQVLSLMNDIDVLDPSESALDSQHVFKQKYKHLSSTSDTLFKYILKNYNQKNFNRRFFQTTLHLMLNNISQIQDNKVTQHNASSQVGEHLAKEYIPHLS
jgi:hypothetical protein